MIFEQNLDYQFHLQETINGGRHDKEGERRQEATTP